MKRFTGHTEKWGEFVDVKINAPEILEKELNRRLKRGMVLLGSVTDAYQPIEKKYQVTRKLLEVLLRHNWPISILTKSDLVLRDIDLLRQFKECEVGFTITTLDEKARKVFEPRSASSQQRLKALGTLHPTGICTYCFIGPILPGITDLRLILTAIQGKVDFIMAETLNMRCGNREDVQEALRRKFPQLLPLYKSGLSKKYWEKVEKELRGLSREFKIPLKGFYRH
jgi:DNA repair photolyase